MKSLRMLSPYVLMLIFPLFITSLEPHANYPDFIQQLGVFGERKVFYTALALLTCSGLACIGLFRLMLSLAMSTNCKQRREHLDLISGHTHKVKNRMYWEEPSGKLPQELTQLLKQLRSVRDIWYKRAIMVLLEKCEVSLAVVKIPLHTTTKVLREEEGGFTLQKWIVDWNLAELPKLEELLQPLKIQADQKLIVLRWLSNGAVLIGLAGALVGLGEALNLIVGGSVNSVELHSLEPLRYSFICSAMGVALAFIFSLIKQLAEGAIDNHFIEITSMLDREMNAVFFPGWESPSMRLSRTVGSLESLSSRLEEVQTSSEKRLVRGIADELTKVTQKFKNVPY